MDGRISEPSFIRSTLKSQPKKRANGDSSANLLLSSEVGVTLFYDSII